MNPMKLGIYFDDFREPFTLLYPIKRTTNSKSDPSILVISHDHPHYIPFKTKKRMTGWWFQPLWKIWKSVGMIIPNWMEK